MSAICLSFPEYRLLAGNHLPYVGPALLYGVVARLAYVYRGRVFRYMVSESVQP